jgi:hypothetical protein
VPRDDRLYSGFVRHDYVLTFAVADDAARARLRDLCAGAWQGDEATPGTWEVSNDLGPDAMESAVLALLAPGDRAVCYYLSDAKRLFRVVLEG